MGEERKIVRAVAWYVLLLALVPAVSEYWAFLAFPPGPVLRLEPEWEAAYGAAGIVVFVLFLWRGERRRLVFGAFAFTLLALYLYGGTPSLDRIISFIAYSALFGIAIEFCRQNRPLYGELKASGVGVGRILLRAALLWSPMLIFVAVGVALHLLTQCFADGGEIGQFARAGPSGLGLGLGKAEVAARAACRRGGRLFLD